MQAIQTKYLPVTTHRPARIKAYCPAGSLAISNQTDFVSHTEEAHRVVAQKLAEKLGWKYKHMSLVAGETKEGFSFVWVDFAHDWPGAKENPLNAVNSLACAYAGTEPGQLNLTYHNNNKLSIEIKNN